MPCEHYKDALIEAAATGAVPQGELRAHLAACDSCRASFEQEQSLFTAIDCGLRTTANDEVPPSLLPRVRASLDEAVMSQRGWARPLIFASASVAFAFLLVLMARPHRTVPVEQARQAPPLPASIKPSTGVRKEGPPARTEIASSIPHHSQSAKHSAFFPAAASSNPEVLVPPDEREAFARFVIALRGHGEVALALVTPAVQTKEESPGIEPLQIKPLEEQQTGSSDGTEQKF
jgi:hypothetical protein